jgi:hypothetical protein
MKLIFFVGRERSWGWGGASMEGYIDMIFTKWASLA